MRQGGSAVRERVGKVKDAMKNSGTKSPAE